MPWGGTSKEAHRGAVEELNVSLQKTKELDHIKLQRLYHANSPFPCVKADLTAAIVESSVVHKKKKKTCQVAFFFFFFFP
jgi:hypothetical protein